MPGKIDLYGMLPPDWREVLKNSWPSASASEIENTLESEQGNFYPSADSIFSALERTRYADVRCVLLGQDPYHEEGQAIGLAFAVPSGFKRPPSLRNLLKEYGNDLGCSVDADQGIARWADQGVLMLNTVLTVRRGEARSHHKIGWLAVTEAILRAVNELPGPIAFLLFGNDAAEYGRLVSARHVVFQCAHPSPLSASRGFFGSRPFSSVNRLLAERGAAEIDWRLQ